MKYAVDVIIRVEINADSADEAEQIVSDSNYSVFAEGITDTEMREITVVGTLDKSGALTMLEE
jgi:hypothetical protein